jgi:ABC-type spermidine/putrescine transport system permease subunit I
MQPRWTILFLLSPAIFLLALLLIIPMIILLDESFHQYIPGTVGSTSGSPLTLQNYTELLSPTYVGFFFETFRLGLIATTLAVALGYPIAYRVARMKSGFRRTTWITFLVAMLFLSAVARVYAVALAFGPVGLLPQIAQLLNANPNSSGVTEAVVIVGLLHYLVPVAALALVGTIQNISPRLIDAAEALGASKSVAHLTILLPLSARGITSAALICMTLCLSAFVIPMVLGKGRVLFVANLIYTRFSEVADYPSGAAISLVMFSLSLLVIYVVTRVTNARWESD